MKKKQFDLLWENCKREIKHHRGNADLMYRAITKNYNKDGLRIKFVSVYVGIQLLYEILVDHFGDNVLRHLDNQGRRCILVKLKIEE